MLDWILVGDSSCDIAPKDSILKTEFATVPLKIEIDGVEHIDDENCSSDSLLAAMKASKSKCSTSCPNIDEFATEFYKAENVICVVISSKLSGSYSAAMQAKNLVCEEFPEKNIHIVDSLGASGALVLALRYADQVIQKGATFPQAVKLVEEYRDSLKLLFSLAKFDNLVRAGRMSKISGAMASALNIRAVAMAKDGVPQVVAKPRGEANAITKMAEIALKDKDLSGKPVVITHCNNLLGANALKKELEKQIPIGEVTILEGHGLTTFYADDRGLIMVY